MPEPLCNDACLMKTVLLMKIQLNKHLTVYTTLLSDSDFSQLMTHVE